MLDGTPQIRLILLFLVLGMAPWNSEGSIYTGGVQYLRFGEITYYPAGEKPVYLSDVRRAFMDGKFTGNNYPDLNLGIARDNYWIRFSVQNKSNSRKLYTVLQNPRLNDVEVFVLKGDSLISRLHVGDNFPFHDRPVEFNHFSFLLDFDESEELEIFLLVRHKGNTLQMPIILMDESQFFTYAETNYLVIGTFTGIFGIAFLFGIFFLVNTRDLLFLYYSGYILFAVLWLWSTEGYGFQYFWPDHPEIATRLGPGISAISATFFIANSLQFTKPYDKGSLFRKVLTVAMLILAVWSILPFLPFIPLTSGTMSAYLSVYFAANILVAFTLVAYFISLSRRGYSPVLYYFGAVAVTILCSFLVIARNTGLFHFQLSSGILMGLGYVIEVILMTAGITKQFYQYKKEKEDTLIAYLEQQKSITSRILETQEQERLRIGRELHDDLGSGLTQIALMSEAARLQTSLPDQKELTQIAQTSRELVSHMGEIIWSLDPENRTVGQLLIYLREELSKLLEYSGIEYRIGFPEVDPSLPLNNIQLRNLFLVVKEAVHNTVKHSNASHVDISCQCEKDRMMFSISDDGKGFVEMNAKGHGLRNMRRRVDEMKGELKLKSEPGKGTTITFTTFFTL